MDTNQMLRNINKELKDLETRKKLDLHFREKEIHGKTIESIWTITPKESEALSIFANKMRGYTPVHVVQKDVINFAHKQPLTHKILGYTTSSYTSDLDTYINKSHYWSKKTVLIHVNSPIAVVGRDSKMKIVYAQNEEMKAVIFTIENYIYITTRSSFNNYLNLLEGKIIIKHKDEPTNMEIMQQWAESF